MGEFFVQELEETIKKSGMCAKSAGDYERLLKTQQQFLEAGLKEAQETVCFYFNIENQKAFSQLRGEKKLNKLRTLLEIQPLLKLFKEYNFSLNPANLYYDRNYRVFVKNRDLYERGIEGSEEEFLKQFKALTGYVMQQKYSFEDYYLGGRDLYKKNSFLKKMDSMETIEDMGTLLLEEYDITEDITLNCRVEVNKTWYQMNRWCLAAAIALITAAGIFIVYMTAVQLPRKNALLLAANSYLDGNYVNVIDALKPVDMKYLDKYQKYILAVSYIKSESLTPEQKENILETITINGEEKQKDYWIYLGRLDTLEAENVAMQRSDNELLLYAYMTEKAILEKNTQISGEEKASRMADLEKKIEELAKQYETEETNKTGE